MRTFHIDEPREIGKKRDRVSSKDLKMVKTDLAEQMTKTFAGEIYWFIDQVVLKKVFSKFKFESIPYHWNAWGFKPADIFSTAKGKKKNDKIENSFCSIVSRS